MTSALKTSFYFLYGMMALCGLFLAPFWLHKALARCSRLHGKQLRRDMYFWIALSVGLLSTGFLLLGVSLSWLNVIYGLNPNLFRPEGMLVLAALALIVVALYIKIWIVDLEHKSHHWLLSSVAISTIWLAFCIALAAGAFR